METEQQIGKQMNDLWESCVSCMRFRSNRGKRKASPDTGYKTIILVNCFDGEQLNEGGGVLVDLLKLERQDVNFGIMQIQEDLKILPSSRQTESFAGKVGLWIHRFLKDRNNRLKSQATSSRKSGRNLECHRGR